MANPFLVEPGNDYGRGLQGLAQTAIAATNARREQQDRDDRVKRFADIKMATIDAYESRDPEKMMKVSVMYPEVAQAMKNSINFYDEQTEESYRDSLFDFVQNPTRENVVRLSEDRKQMFKDKDMGPEQTMETDGFLAEFDADPEGTLREQTARLSFMYPTEMKAMREAMGGDPAKLPTTAMGQFIKKNPDATEEQLVSFSQKLKAGGGSVVGKTYSKKNPDGSVRTIKNVQPGSQQEAQLLEGQFVEGSQTVPAKMSGEERKQQRINKATDKLTAMATEDPNKFYKDHSYRQNDDGSLYIDPVSGGPQELKPFTNTLGKRGNMKAIIGLGEQWDDAKELTELLDLPSVQANLKKAETDGLWDQAKSKWNNKVGKWMQDAGIKGDSPTATAIARIQRMASEERKLYMGTAVTDNEMRSALAWMPNAGDSFDSVMNKTRLMGQEAEQAFRRYVDVSEQAGADMSPFMSAFGIEKFPAVDESAVQTQVAVEAPQAAIEALNQNPQLREQFQAKYGYLPEGM